MVKYDLKTHKITKQTMITKEGHYMIWEDVIKELNELSWLKGKLKPM